MQTRNVLEACLLVAARPMTVPQLDALFEEDIDRPDRKAIREALAALADSYVGRGIELVEVAGGWRLQTRASVEHWVTRLSPEKAPRYSRALLETLVLIAYRQPITRGEIEEVRGVAVSSNIVRTLQDRRWVREVGFKEVPGKPALLGTTSEFLDYFNLRRLDELPPLGELQDIDGIEALLAAELEVVEGGEAANDEDGESPDPAVASDTSVPPVSDAPDTGTIREDARDAGNRGTGMPADADEASAAGTLDAPDVPDVPDAPDAREAKSSDVSIEPEPEPEPESGPSGSAGLSLSAVAARFVASTDADDGVITGAAGAGSDRTEISAVATVKIDETPIRHRSESDGGAAMNAAASDGGDDADSSGARETFLGDREAGDRIARDVAEPSGTGSGPASVAGADEMDTDVAVAVAPESDDHHGTGTTTASGPADEVDGSGPPSGAQARLLDAVTEFAQEHRRELHARDKWNARVAASADHARSARHERPDSYPGGRPGTAPAPADPESGVWRADAPPQRDEERDDTPRDGPATPDDGDP